jgi:uncharacterized membrane protein
MPTDLRRLAWAGLGAIAAFFTTMVVALALDFSLFARLVGFSVLTVVSGREAAMLLAYQGPDAVDPVWIFLVTLLQDLAALFLIIPLVWLGAERLREAYLIGGIILSLEKAALTHRRLVDRWGLAGLSLLVVFPGFGTGVATAAAIGALARIPARKLALVLGAVLVAMVGAYSIGLRFAASALEAVPGLHWVPLALVGTFVLVGTALAIRERGRRNVLPIRRVGFLNADEVERLRDYGIRDGTDLFYVDCRILAARLGVSHNRLARCRAVSELCLVRGVSPRDAEMLSSVGILTIRALASAPPSLVGQALEELEAGHGDANPSWVDRAPAWRVNALTHLGEEAASVAANRPRTRARAPRLTANAHHEARSP